MAAGYGNDDMVDLLLRRGADSHVKAKDGANALDFALTGVSDINKFTLFRCQNSTVSLLLRRNPDLHGTARASSRAWAKMKRCVTPG
jgi:ankyrin repeat protein